MNRAAGIRADSFDGALVVNDIVDGYRVNVYRAGGWVAVNIPTDEMAKFVSEMNAALPEEKRIK